MRLATFNLENFFQRAKALNQPWQEGKPILEDFHQLSTIINNETYSEDDMTTLRQIMGRYKGLLTNGASDYIILREIRGRSLSKGNIVANGRVDWIGWFELAKETIKEPANRGYLATLLRFP